MKGVVKKPIRDEKGAALALALVLLVVGGLILTPLLGLMSTGLVSGQLYERKTDELYAADAGVEDAVWKIQQQVEQLPAPGCGGEEPEPWSYNITDSVNKINGKNVEVTIAWVNNLTYQVESTATGDGTGTQIDAYITGSITYSSIMDHLITIEEDLTEQQISELEQDLGKLNVTCPSGCMDCGVCKRVYDYDSDAYRSISRECKGCIAVYNFPAAGWPTADALSALYLRDVEGATHYDSDTEIDLTGKSCPPGPIYINEQENDSWPSGLGPLYVDGKLDIVNKSSTGAALTLNGTLYITGDTTINGPNDKDPLLLTLDLNGNTIFVSSNTSKALQITQCIVKGPGVIIAVGDIKFAPKMEGGGAEPVFVLSVSGTTSVFPSGDIYGAIAGKIDVDIGSGKNPSTIYPSGGFGDLTLPFRVELLRSYGIASWEIKPP